MPNVPSALRFILCANRRHLLLSGVGLSILALTGPVCAQTVSDSAPLRQDTGGISEVVDEGDLTIEVGELFTFEPDEVGISATNTAADGHTKVTADFVLTQGQNATGISVMSQHSADITVGLMITEGDFAEGILALTQTGNLNVSADQLTTAGTEAIGIYAESIEGNVAISVNQLATLGAQSHGVYAAAWTGNVSVEANTVESEGTGAYGVIAFSSIGTTEAKIGTVRTIRDDAGGVYLGGGLGVNAIISKVSTSGFGATGIEVIAGNLSPELSTTGNVKLQVGTVETKGVSAAGASVFAFGDIDLKVDSARTQGMLASAIQTRTEFGNSRLEVNNVLTSGELAHGIRASSLDGSVTIKLNKGQTEGDGSSAVFADVNFGNLDILITGDLATKGEASRGVISSSLFGDTLVVTQGKIKTQGGFSQGIYTSAAGRTFINATDIETLGNTAIGIEAFSASDFGLGIAERAINITAQSIHTSGAFSHGIKATNLDGGIITRLPVRAADDDEPVEIDNSINIRAGTIKTTGADAVGILAKSVGDVNVEADNVSSAMAQALLIEARANVSVKLNGAISSLNNTAVSITGENVATLVSKGAKVTSSGDAFRLSAVGPYVPPDDGGGIIIGPFAAASPGVAMFENAGDIVASDAAIRLLNGTGQVRNSGRIEGALIFADGDDVVENTGTLVLSPNYDFGDGQDLLINKGTVKFATAIAPQAITLQGLERFNNDGGLIDLRNGTAGDVLTLPGAYAASGNARLALDVGTAADRLVISGAVTGKTSIVLEGIGASKAILLGDNVRLVSASGTVAPDAFTLEKTDIGLVRYGLKSVSGGLVLTTQAGTPIHGALLANQSSEGLLRQAGDAWSTIILNARDGTETAGGRIWAQAYGASAEYSAIADDDVAVGADQDVSGGQFGGELGVVTSDKDTLAFGVTGGFGSSDLRAQASTQKTKIETVNLGAYLTARHGSYFFNALAQAAQHSIDIEDGALGYSSDLNGTTFGARAELGVQVKGAWLTYEPLVGIAWSRTSWDDLKALGQTFNFDNTESLTGQVGGRISGQAKLNAGSQIAWYARAAAVHQFKGTASGTFLSGTAADQVKRDGRAGYGELAVGLSYQTAARTSVFLEATGSEGKGYSSTSGRIGLRYRF